MAGRNVPVVVFPRFTGLVGNGTYWSEPIPVSAYDTLAVNLWNGNLIGVGASLTPLFQQSNDLVTWNDCTGTAPGTVASAADVAYREDLNQAWFRMGVTVSGTNPGVSISVQGFLELRER